VTAEAFIINEKNNGPEINNMDKHPSTKSESLHFVTIPEMIAILYLRTSLTNSCISKRYLQKGNHLLVRSN
jgi:hypothetical protein